VLLAELRTRYFLCPRVFNSNVIQSSYIRNIKEFVWQGVHWIHVAQERNQTGLLKIIIIIIIINLYVPDKARNFLTDWAATSIMAITKYD
jgi:hypothetical protein